MLTWPVSWLILSVVWSHTFALRELRSFSVVPFPQTIVVGVNGNGSLALKIRSFSRSDLPPCTYYQNGNLDRRVRVQRQA